MTVRFLTLAVFAGALALAGCGDSSSTGRTDTDLDDLANADPFDQLAYNAGYSSASRYLSQLDSTVSYDVYLDGFQAGLANDSSRIAYALGLQDGLQMRADTLSNVNSDLFLVGFREAIDGDSARLNQEQLQSAFLIVQDSMEMRSLRSDLATQMTELRTQAATDSLAEEYLVEAERNQARSDSFFTAISQQPGIESASGGLYYTIDEPGEGEPLRAQAVMVTYEGRTIDGDVFDASTEPVRMDLNQVVPGFRRTLAAMAPGETRTVYIPPMLGYGLGGNPQAGLAPNVPLVFELTLVGPAPQQQMQGLPPGMMMGN